MGIKERSYVPNNTIKSIKEGMTVEYTKDSIRNTGTKYATIFNIRKNVINNEFVYTFNLMDAKTGVIFSKPDGEPKTWVLKNALESGAIKILDDNLQACPKCGRKILSEGQTICYECAHGEKKEFFDKKVALNDDAFTLDDEQVDAILSDTNTIVTARAGSGKTRVLTAKLIDLFYNQGIREDEVLAFCFNKDAADEIRKRINSKCVIDGVEQENNYNVVNTFHAFAKFVLGNDFGQILVDDTVPVRTKLIKQIISELRHKNAAFEGQVRKYFLASTLKIDRKKFTSMDAYYRFVRNSRYRTLNGEHVKSKAEKIIADFLFEHDIKYDYERHFYLNKVDLTNHRLSQEEFFKYKSLLGGKGETIPDFYLQDFGLVWEHWGITGNETREEQIEFSKEVGDYDEYKRTMGWKRSFWKYWRFKLTTTQNNRYNFKTVKGLIETNPDISEGQREDVELKIKSLLESRGIKCEKLPGDLIMQKVWKNAEDYFTRLIRQFIDKFQQMYFDNEQAFLEQAKNVENDREKVFLRLGYMVYQRYIQVLSGDFENYPEFKHYRLDFNQSLYKATKKIESGELDAMIKQLKWILIDEYQDFSELFHKLIKAVLSRNPEIKLFCVGDDWQAINKFAGADLKFFLDFKNYFPNSDKCNIKTNYRSENHIVAYAGNFMERFAVSGQAQKGFLADTGRIEENAIESFYFDSDIDDYNWIVNKGGPWQEYERVGASGIKNIQAYIKTCARIINDNPGKKIMILNRKSTFLGKDLDEIERILKHPRLCKVEEPDILVKTVHRAKGEEADIVILTEVDENCFPIFHPDSNLFGIFGENENTIMDDETRLYYVALTRAKSSLYIFYSKDAPSMFIENPHFRPPQREFTQTDPVEKNPEYKDAFKTVEELVKKEIGVGGYMGYCHKYWHYKKKYLKELFNIDWKSPAELNPDTKFD